MSSSYIVEPQEGSSKKDDTLILMVNDNGVISVDQDTLQNLILNQSNASVSVVRLGQTENDAAEGNITLTVDPPQYVPPETNISNNTSDSAALVDPFMEMDPEQLEKLETALQSEEAKQILGENVTAMLDMLTVEEQQNSIRYSIELDHCYTSRFSPSQPKPVDPLPDVSLSDMDESMIMETNKPIIHTPQLSPVSSNNANTSIIPMKQKVNSIPPKIVKQPASVGGRPRRSSAAMQPISTTPKSTVSINARSLVNAQDGKLNTKDDAEAEEDELFSSSESSESQESDSDSDFGPRPRRGVRARGGRRGLTTRGGSMAASRRRASNKHMDSEQVRRLDMEMAAAVNAMKSPDKDDKQEKYCPLKNRKSLKVLSAKKKEDISAPTTPVVAEPPPVEANVLQTTNQVKANLINANMFKGDMILTKPGQDRNNQKVVFIQKQIAMSPNDAKTLGIKKQVMIPKSKLITQTQKVPVAKEAKIATPSPNVAKVVAPSIQQTSSPQNQHVSPIEPVHNQIHLQKVATVVTKTKPVEVKKEKKKADAIPEIHNKTTDVIKPAEAKTPTVAKKIVKKEHRKSDAHVVEALGPALFSTPDIIRRVGSIDSKTPEANAVVTPTSPLTVASSTSTNIPVAVTAANTLMILTPSTSTVTNMPPEPMETIDSTASSLTTKTDLDASLLSETLGVDKMDSKAAIVDLLQPALESASNPTPSKELSSTMEQSNDSKHNVSETGIEGDDHLLATLGMEAAKQLPNDEEFLAEALLLQETLGVDLDHSGLVDPTPEMPEPILSSSIEEPAATPSTEIAPNVKIGAMPVMKKEVPSVTPSPTSVQTLIAKNEYVVKKEAKEPVQIIRGGRVITLPPIEAPATRSKRLQAKVENQQVKEEKKQQILQLQPKVEPPVKSERTIRNSSNVSSLQKQDMIYDMEYDDKEEEEEPNSDSEDDPNRLWCICRQPHNNRFMICCDMCGDWFHGKCVHVTKAMGEQMESQGIEWVCPNCSKKKSEDNKSKSISRRQRNSIDSTSEQTKTLATSSNPITTDIKASPNSGKSSASGGVTDCVVCKKEVRKSSIYCSDACILAHAEVTSTKPSPSPLNKTPKSETPKQKSDVRIIVYDKKSGKVLTGANAPTESNLKTWLKEHPTYEVMKPNSLNTLQIGGKTVAAIQTQGIKTNKQLQGKSSGQAKMVYSKVPGLKQTVLAPSTKKAVLLTDTPTRATVSPQQRLKQSAVSTPGKSLQVQQKQSNIKSALQIQQQQQLKTPQKPVATSTPKPNPRKSLEAKPSTSQQKIQQQPQVQQQQIQQQQSQSQQKQDQQQVATKTPPPRKPTDTEPIRLNVRKTLAELLTNRIRETADLKLTDEEILELALQIELEMFKFFKDTGTKYKAKYRSLVFNIKDMKNLTLFRKIADHSLTPEAVVKLSPDEMASQELAEWREKENKHQLEMIKKNELDLMAQAKSIVVKTHKGEQIIENDGEIETPVQDIVSAFKSGDVLEDDNKEKEEDAKKREIEEEDKKKKKKEKDRDRDKRRNRSRSKDGKRERSRSKSRHRHKDRERSRDRKSKKDSKHRDRSKDKDHDKSKDRKKDKKDKHKRSRSSSRTRSKTAHKDHKEKMKKGDDEKKKDSSLTNVEKPIEDRLWRHIEDETTTNTFDSDISDREPSSTVTIKTPDINEELDKELELSRTESITTNEAPKATTVWRGCVFMADVAKFYVTAQNVSGKCKELLESVPDTFDVVGRISPNTVWEYIAKMKKSANKEIVIIRLTATNDEEKIPYITLYSYLNSRNRLGVLGNVSPLIKDFYIMPFSIGSKLPSVLLPLDGPGFEEARQHLLLGIIVVNSRRKRVANAPPPLTPIASKVAKKEQQQQPTDRSYTPPPPLHLLPSSVKDDSSTPPGSPKALLTQIRMVESKQSFSVISKIVPELSSKITLESSSSSDKMPSNDDDEPYSPGEPVDIVLDDDEDALSSSSSSLKMSQLASDTSATPVKSSFELQRKMEELSRQIEEEKLQIKSMSMGSTFLNESATTLPGLGLDPPDSGDAVEAYSPSDTRSFTPPPQSIPKLSQPILEKVSNITIPANLQEILANVKRQESSKIDPYLPSKPGATFLTTANQLTYLSQEKYSPSQSRASGVKQTSSEVQSSPRKEAKSTLSSLSDYDIIKKAEEELAALEAATVVATPTVPAPLASSEPPPPGTSFDSPHR